MQQSSSGAWNKDLFLFCPDLVKSTQHKQPLGVCVSSHRVPLPQEPQNYNARDGDVKTERASRSPAASHALTWGEPPGEKPWLETGEVGDWLAEDPTLLRYCWREEAWYKRTPLSYWQREGYLLVSVRVNVHILDLALCISGLYLASTKILIRCVLWLQPLIGGSNAEIQLQKWTPCAKINPLITLKKGLGETEKTTGD